MWPVIERAVRNAHAAYIDFRLFVTGKADRELPPLRLRDVGGGDFRTIGRHLFDLTVRYGALRPDSHLLDIGCGAGRLALPLTSFLTSGLYEGFDVSRGAIRWCTRHISRRHPSFRFSHVSLRNSHYASRGGGAAEFEFPHREASFDRAVAYSLFTHFTFAETANYLMQTYRVLAPGGRLVSTYFLINDDSEAAAVRQFPYEEGPVRFASRSDPALAVAIQEQFLLAILGEIGFREITIEPGRWYGAEGAPTYQDLVVCTK